MRDENLRTDPATLDVQTIPSTASSPDTRVVPSGPRSEEEIADLQAATTLGDGLRGPTLDMSALPRGVAVGRYVVIERIAEGGLGVVYKAYDRELDRRVAIKLVRAHRQQGEGAAEARVRLLREAQALAKLDHPNVVPVFDVGAHGDGIFLAMAYIEGVTVATWLKATPRTVAEIRRVFAAAGEGLHAAHQAGLVHRDFKPENVLVTDDGTVRVVDFGLARPTALRSTGESDPGVLAFESGDSALVSPLTRIGVRIGTPLYMAPEQHLGGEVDARSDQFSFSVSLYEAVYGSHPFPARTMTELVGLVTAGRPKLGAGGANRRVPRWMRAILFRGLAPQPHDRYPSMAELVHDLRTERGAKERRRIVLGGAAVLAAAVLAFVGRGSAMQVPVCEGAAARLVGVWDSDQRASVRQAFERSGAVFARRAVAAVEAGLDAYAGAWVSMHEDSCRATRVRGQQSEALFDLRAQCLERRLSEMRAVVQVFAQADRATVDRAAQAVEALPSLDTCADLAALRAPVPLPAAEAGRARIADVRKTLAEVDALRIAGQVRPAYERASRALEAARAAGYRPVEAEALLLHADLQESLGDYKAALVTAQGALAAAVAARHDEVEARAWILLLNLAGDRLGRSDDALGFAPLTKAAIERLDRPESLLAAYHRAVSVTYFRKEDYGAARTEAERALGLSEKLHGADSPSATTALVDLANVAHQLGANEEAARLYERALEARRKAFGEGHVSVAMVCNNLGITLSRLHRYDEARHMLETAGRIWREALGPRHPHLAAVANNVAEILIEEGRLGDARARLEEALRLNEENLGPEHTEVAGNLLNLGRVLLRLGAAEEAKLAFQRAQAITTKSLGPDAAFTAYAYAGLGKYHLARGALGPARQELERALAVWARHPVDDGSLAETRLDLAVTLEREGKERERARRLASEARLAFERAGDAPRAAEAAALAGRP